MIGWDQRRKWVETGRLSNTQIGREEGKVMR